MEVEYDVGDTVYCVDDRKTRPEHAFVLKWPQKDKKYTVRGFTTNNDIVLGVYLEELVNPVVKIKLPGGQEQWEQEIAFATWRFKKAQTQSAEEVSVLKQIKGNSQEVGDYELIEFPAPGKLNAGDVKLIVKYHDKV